MIARFLRLAVPVLVLGALAGCSKQYHIEIQSDTCWHGVVNTDQNFTDCGNSRYRVVGKLQCVVVQKNGANGYLRVRVDGGSWAETSEPYGTVQVCE